KLPWSWSSRSTGGWDMSALRRSSHCLHFFALGSHNPQIGAQSATSAQRLRIMPSPHRVAARFAAALAACLLLTAAASAEPKAVVSSKSKSAEIAVTIDDDLKAHPGLYDNLLAEGRREAAKWRAEADDILRKGADPMTFK